MEKISDSPIVSASHGCLKAFNLLSSGLAGTGDDNKRWMTPMALSNQRDRFKVWAGNVGALQRGRASLDFRLRESSLMRTNFLELLSRLKDTLSRSRHIY
jgi:hypothetical protein